ncbi:PLP-dependent aminotransferase family protein [Mammaliicoccus sp. Dog046]|uniref:MocR-like pyridoxine biosynthesis transcription factor PdxR n=1 Tax=Mammaliicoccus sp. Dog046 TaxID=3034233 RepID=UPI002B260952|nr:PLP-dependent aminotransferase family protein [Mammaliicoccus sp. Dog046]WQK85322.1 PLP-dependent aminotransferase family protein [Mammaliicoccus sp. Dog046]
MEMLMFNINRDISTPIYLQLYENIKQNIINNTMQHNEKLPSKRQLSHYLSVSQTTIEHAYQLLCDEGYILSRSRSGFYINDIVNLPVTYKTQLPTESDENESLYQYRFKLGAIDKSHFPNDLFRKYAKESFDDHQICLLDSGHKQGDYNLRKEIRNYIFHSRGVNCLPQQIIIGSSTEQLLSILTDILSDAKYMIEDPIYKQVRNLLKRKHVPFEFIPVNSNGIDIEQIIRTDFDVVYITPSHQFPTGVIMDLKRRTQLIKWASEKNSRYIIEDDYDSEFRYSGRPIPALQSLDNTGRVIYVSTFSKSISPSIRVAYAVLPQELLSIYRKKTNIEGGTVPRHTQYTLGRFMSDGHFERHLNRMRKIYRNKRDIIIRELKKYPDIFSISGELTGMHFILTVTNGLSLEDCVHRVEQMNIDIKPLAHYRFKQNDHIPQFVLGFGGIPDEDLENHIHALIQCFTK